VSDDQTGRVLSDVLVLERVFFMVPKYYSTVDDDVQVLLIVEDDLPSLLFDHGQQGN